VVEHSYSDCQKVGRAANNANTTIMTIQLDQSTLVPRTNMSVANMATEASRPLTNGTGPKSSMTEPIQFSMALPNAPGSRIHTHLTILATSILLFCTSTTAEFSTAAVPSLGSFVYAMPDVCIFQTSYPNSYILTLQPQRYNPSAPLSTPLYTLPSSLDFADRLAKTLARRTNLPVQVGSSVNFSSAGNGGSVEEEMEAFRQLVTVVLREVEKARAG
jgi:hypothetical protein